MPQQQHPLQPSGSKETVRSLVQSSGSIVARTAPSVIAAALPRARKDNAAKAVIHVGPRPDASACCLCDDADDNCTSSDASPKEDTTQHASPPLLSVHNEAVAPAALSSAAHFADDDGALDNSMLCCPIVAAEVSTSVVIASPIRQQRRSHNSHGSNLTPKSVVAAVPVDNQFVVPTLGPPILPVEKPVILPDATAILHVPSSQEQQCTEGVTAAAPAQPQPEQALQTQRGFPAGLAHALTTTHVQQQHWLLDNSTRMHQTADAKRVVFRTRNNNHKTHSVTCTRWEELRRTVEDHLKLSAIVTREEDQHRRVTTTTIRTVHGRGTTSSVGDLRSNLRAMEASGSGSYLPSLRALQRDLSSTRDTRTLATPWSTVVVLATDAWPDGSSGHVKNSSTWTEFHSVLQQFRNLSIRVVIRLCTADPAIVDFYQSLEQKVVHVIQPFLREAATVRSHNPFLHYSLPLHLVREGGQVFHHHRHPTLHLLSRRRLRPTEIPPFLVLLWGDDIMAKAPTAAKQQQQQQKSHHAYCKFVATVVQGQGRHWSPYTRQTEGWVDVRQLQKAMAATTTTSEAGNAFKEPLPAACFPQWKWWWRRK